MPSFNFDEILKIFKVVAAEFADASDETVTQWIELTAPFVNKKRFRKLYTQALALLTAHRMKLAGLGVIPRRYCERRCGNVSRRRRGGVGFFRRGYVKQFQYRKSA